MKPTVTIREYSVSTGEFLRSGSLFVFGHILSGDTCGVKLFDFVITGVSDIQNFTISLLDSEGLEVSHPEAVVVDNVSDGGNFGIETSATFVIKVHLSSFFSGLDIPVSVPMRSSNVSNFVYLNMSPGTFEKITGRIKYGVGFSFNPTWTA